MIYLLHAFMITVKDKFTKKCKTDEREEILKSMKNLIKKTSENILNTVWRSSQAII